jgi:hypothetical protein
MGEDLIAELDAALAEVLPENPADGSGEIRSERKEEMVELLQYAADELDRSPSLRQFNSLDLETSGYTIEYAFGTWNEAKREAGLEVYEPGEGRYPSTPIEEEYFESIDTKETAYWFGTLFAKSSVKLDESTILSVSRTGEKRHFVHGLSDAVDSEYAITEYSQKHVNDQTQTIITNERFVDNLLSAGYPDPDDEPELPPIREKLRPSFVRGYIESNSQFQSKSGWELAKGNPAVAECLRSWFEDFGAKRPTLGTTYGDTVLRVANVFDIKAVFETCWPDGLDTEPSFSPYAERVLEYLESEYPYPGNVSYLSE